MLACFPCFTNFFLMVPFLRCESCDLIYASYYLSFLSHWFLWTIDLNIQITQPYICVHLLDYPEKWKKKYFEVLHTSHAIPKCFEHFHLIFWDSHSIFHKAQFFPSVFRLLLDKENQVLIGNQKSSHISWVICSALIHTLC